MRDRERAAHAYRYTDIHTKRERESERGAAVPLHQWFQVLYSGFVIFMAARAFFVSSLCVSRSRRYLSSVSVNGGTLEEGSPTSSSSSTPAYSNV